MPSDRPFFTAPAGGLDVDQLLAEAAPLAKLVAAVGAVALVPVLAQVVLLDVLGVFPFLAGVLSFATQFVLAVGTGLVLTYVVSRGTQLAAEHS